MSVEITTENDDTDEQECGYVYDHDEEVVYEGEDGIQWDCRRCGAEGFIEPEEQSSPSGASA